MRRLVTTLTACLLACIGTAPVSAQEASPLVPPPPGFGGQRVEMPEHGFALTLPDGWEVLDVDQDHDLMVGDMLTGQVCWTDTQPTAGDAIWESVDFADFAEFMHGELAGQFESMESVDVGPTVEVGIPAGPAFVIDLASLGTGQERSLVMAEGWVEGTERILSLECAGEPLLDDTWLTIAETIEFLPTEE